MSEFLLNKLAGVQSITIELLQQKCVDLELALAKKQIEDEDKQLVNASIEQEPLLDRVFCEHQIEDGFLKIYFFEYVKDQTPKQIFVYVLGCGTLTHMIGASTNILKMRDKALSEKVYDECAKIASHAATLVGSANSDQFNNGWASAAMQIAQAIGMAATKE